MRYSGLQPQYFPRLHYIARILNADIFVIRDDVQFVRKHKYPDGIVGKSYQVHTPIKSANGVNFLTLPVKHNGRQTLAKTNVSYESTWIDDHLQTIMYAYKKASNFKHIQPELVTLLYTQYQTLAALNTATILWSILKLLGEENVTVDKLHISYVEKKLSEQKVFRLKKIIKESETETIKNYPEFKKNERIIALCKEVGADEDYCGGTATAAYVDHSLFEQNGIKITVQDWECQQYNQLHTTHGFVHNLSIIDLLMNLPYKEAQGIIRNKQESTVQKQKAALIYGIPTMEFEFLGFFAETVLSKGIII